MWPTVAPGLSYSRKRTCDVPYNSYVRSGSLPWGSSATQPKITASLSRQLVMDNKELYLSSLDMSMHLCTTIYQMADNAKTNKRKCQEIVQRVKALEALLFTIKKKKHDEISESVENALKELCNSLKSLKKLMEKVSQNNAITNFTRSKTRRNDKFTDVDERLIDNFKALCEFFLIDQGKNPSMRAQMTQFNATPPMMPDPRAQMTQFNATPPMMPDPRAQMTQPNATAPMMPDPRAQMTQPNAMTYMMPDPRAQMTQPNAMTYMMPDPRAQMTQPNAITYMMADPRAQMTQPNATTYMTMHPAGTPYPSQSTMPTFTMRNPTIPVAFSASMPSKEMSNSISPLSSILFPTPTHHNSTTGMMAPMNVSRQTTPAVQWVFTEARSSQ
ncbi:hypothetical protein EYF80_037686 [Liparis tanakae]|uniref:Mixed lineage kinase domain-containing protein n=1 Tax=Liparis tanakae TaxID=230148 RepID=A0A4Z2GF57_9TELE|nr:hypothetical protein EYF80_037686 [Liparis tanakae]